MRQCVKGLESVLKLDKVWETEPETKPKVEKVWESVLKVQNV